jgi:DNA-directed RNA polymerase specialized sigma24 family protein
VDKETGEMIVIPSREDSYERLLEAEKQFAEETEKVEDVAVRAVMLEKLNEVLRTLTDEETASIHALCYQEISEVELAKKLGIARTIASSFIG